MHEDIQTSFKTRFANRWHARRAARADAATGFVSQPEPRAIGSFARGKQLVAGNFLFAGMLVEAPTGSIWDIDPPSAGFAAEIHGFIWLDDLASLGNFDARLRAQTWVGGWIAQFGGGTGPGWTPDLTGRRLIRWINHALFLMAGMSSEQSNAFFRSLGQQTIFLSRRWKATTPGLARFEALVGMIYAGLSLTGMEDHVAPAISALSKECHDQIDAQGGIPTRNPEELLEVFTLLAWAALALRESGQEADPEHLAALARIAPTLRALRHSDGALARFHGGGRGLEGRLDHALATSGVRSGPHRGLSMGYIRLAEGRANVVVDAAAPPSGAASENAHASTLAFELTSGRRPLIVNCGSGAQFGEEWRKAGRATPSHSTLGIQGVSSSRVSAAVKGQGTRLVKIPSLVRSELFEDVGLSGVTLAHDGYVPSHGLQHMRKLVMTVDGRGLRGEDTLAAAEKSHQQVFDRALDRTKLQGIPYDIRFHLHPDVDATLDLGGTAVSMALKSGEIWIFRFEGKGVLALEQSVYMEKTRLKPRATKQMVLSGVAMDYATRVRWSLTKAQDTPSVMRDLERDGLELPI